MTKTSYIVMPMQGPSQMGGIVDTPTKSQMKNRIKQLRKRTSNKMAIGKRKK